MYSTYEWYYNDNKNQKRKKEQKISKRIKDRMWDRTSGKQSGCSNTYLNHVWESIFGHNFPSDVGQATGFDRIDFGSTSLSAK